MVQATDILICTRFLDLEPKAERGQKSPIRILVRKTEHVTLRDLHIAGFQLRVAGRFKAEILMAGYRSQECRIIGTARTWIMRDVTASMFAAFDWRQARSADAA